MKGGINSSLMGGFSKFKLHWAWEIVWAWSYFFGEIFLIIS